MLKLWYFTLVFFVTKRFMGTNILTLWHWPWSLIKFLKILTLLYKLLIAVSAIALIFLISIPCGKIFPWVPKVKPLTLTFVFRLCLENFHPSCLQLFHRDCQSFHISVNIPCVKIHYIYICIVTMSTKSLLLALSMFKMCQSNCITFISIFF